MGVENSILKKKKNKNGVIKFAKKNFKHRASETLETKKVPTILDNINPDDNIFETRPQSRTVKMLNYQKTSEDKTIKSEQERENCLKNLKSLSVENLVKIENHNDEVLPGSLETNCSSNKSKEDFKKILNDDDVYNDMDENNSFEEENEDNNEEEKEENENDAKEVEKKKKELMVTNNMKTVFIDSKPTNKEENEESKLSTSTSTSPMTTFDYELNFYRNGNDIRQSYLAKLLSTKVWTPNMKPKQHNSIIIFDWDDTLLPTSFLTPGGVFNENMKIPKIEVEKLLKLEQAVLKLLTEAVEKGNVYIITNAGDGWVEYSAKRFYPSIMPILEKIQIISARGQYEKIFPGNSRQWKIEAFLNLQKSLNITLVTNIICIGDSLFEMEAGRILASRFTEAFIKTIKFREAPKLDELLKQLKLVCVQFGSIYSSIKNLTIRVERKKKEGK
jgi:hypothetical protein